MYRELLTRSRGTSFVVPEQPTQPCPTFDRDGVGRFAIRLWPVSCERNVAQRLMRTLGVVVLDVLGDQVIEVLLAEYDEVVQRFLLQTLDEPVWSKSSLTISCYR